ncbi:UNVERIFIED_CONTAM: putative transcription factor PosF21 [Sesamum radiatum]|uniref:Transcription factor PosF21 n=1 Tax=Sesamum radiatum TaxID=300843 RepID=A0AAW2SLB6_SESRA
MDKEKIHHGTGSLLPPPGRYSAFSPPNSSYNTKSELSGSSNLPLVGAGILSEQDHFGHGMSDSSRFSHDISQMPDNPPKNLGHRRAHSEILTLPDDISFDSDLGVVGGLDGPSFSDETEDDLLSTYLDMDKFNSTTGLSEFQVGDSSTLAAKQGSSSTPAIESSNPSADNVATASNEKPRIRHQHSQSMDGSTTIKPEMLMSGSEGPSPAETKKAISAAKLAELALIDPKRAKSFYKFNTWVKGSVLSFLIDDIYKNWQSQRIWANRQSAARSKERKMRYIAELERKLQSLQTEATSLSAQFTLLQLQTMEQQVQLQDALNDSLKEEIQHLKALTGQTIPNGGPMMSIPTSYGSNQQYYPNNHNHTVNTLLTAQKLQQLQLHSQKQQHQFHQNHLHPFQQQQLQQPQSQSSVQQQEQQLQRAGDMKLRSSLPSST